VIREVKLSDAEAIVDIYNHYVRTSIATFELDEVTTDEMQSRIQKVLDCNFPWLVSVDEQEQVIGYAYVSYWKERKAYQHSVEITVYLKPDMPAKGLGSRLYDALFQRLKALPVNAVIAGISLPNEASVKLHEKFGMTKVAHFKAVGLKFEQWIDVGYWQVQLNDI